jgi:hypothetical protein
LIFAQHESIPFSYHFSFLLILGPEMPKAIRLHSLHEIQGDVYLFGGQSGGSKNSAIYQLSCSSGNCSWSTVTQVLKVARYLTVVIPVSDTLTSCVGM